MHTYITYALLEAGLSPSLSLSPSLKFWEYETLALWKQKRLMSSRDICFTFFCKTFFIDFPFSIDIHTGELYAKGFIDREARENYNFEVSVSITTVHSRLFLAENFLPLESPKIGWNNNLVIFCVSIFLFYLSYPIGHRLWGTITKYQLWGSCQSERCKWCRSSILHRSILGSCSWEPGSRTQGLFFFQVLFRSLSLLLSISRSHLFHPLFLSLIGTQSYSSFSSFHSSNLSRWPKSQHLIRTWEKMDKYFTNWEKVMTISFILMEKVCFILYTMTRFLSFNFLLCL